MHRTQGTHSNRQEPRIYQRHPHHRVQSQGIGTEAPGHPLTTPEPAPVQRKLSACRIGRNGRQQQERQKHPFPAGTIPNSIPRMAQCREGTRPCTRGSQKQQGRRGIPPFPVHTAPGVQATARRRPPAGERMPDAGTCRGNTPVTLCRLPDTGRRRAISP